MLTCEQLKWGDLFVLVYLRLNENSASESSPLTVRLFGPTISLVPGYFHVMYSAINCKKITFIIKSGCVSSSMIRNVKNLKTVLS